MSLFRCFSSGGVQRDALAIASAAIARGHRVTMLTTQWHDLAPPEQGLNLNLIETRGATNHQQLLRFSRQVQALSGDYDACLGFSPGPSLSVFFAANNCLAHRMANRPSWLKLLPRYRTLLKLEREALSASQVLFLTPTQQRDYAAHYSGYTPHFLPPALQMDRINALDSEQSAQRALNLPPHRWLVLQVGASLDTKGLDRSVDIAAALPATLRDQVLLLLVGGVHPRLRQRAQRQGVRLHMLPPLKQLSQAYRQADVMLHPARREAGGKVLLEAMAHGLPVLATAGCGYAALVSDAGAGAVISQPFVREAAAWQLQEMLQADAQRELMRAAGLAWYEQQVPGAFEEAVVQVLEQT